MAFENEFEVAAGSNADGTRPVLSAAWGATSTPAEDAYGASYGDLGVLHATEDIYRWKFAINNIGTAANSRTGMVKIGIDLAGGTSYTDIIVNLPVGPAEGHANGRDTVFEFQYLIPAGASIGFKTAVHSSTLTAIRAWIFDCKHSPDRAELVMAGSTSESFGGSVSTCQGVTVVPGTTSEGAWTEIGTLASTLWWWEYGPAISDAVIASNAELHIDIAIGPTGSERVIIRNHSWFYNTNEVSWRPCPAGVFAVGVSGEKVWARAQCSATLEDGTISIGVIGIGGSELAASGSAGYSRSRIVNV